MLNFKKLKITKHGENGSMSSFVGIRRDNENQLEFRLPRGFKQFPENDFKATKNLFFKMYQTFKKFENNQQQKTIDKSPAAKDNTETLGNAYAFKDSDNNDVILYSKISIIEKMLDAYKDLSLNFIEKCIGKSDQIDYRKIDDYLDKAIYLENDVIYVDEMEMERYVLHYQPNSLINLFCFIVRELKNELDHFIDAKVNELANIFTDHNLSPDQSLFEEDTFESTIAALKDILHDIDKNTAYKDSQYWLLFEAIEFFLYGELNMENTHEEGIFWGINNFFQIWEDMCNTYAFSKFSVAYADTNIVYNGQRVANHKVGSHHLFKLHDLSYPFFIKFREQTRWMRPDLVIFTNENKNQNIFDKDISINLKKQYGRIADYEIKLNDISKKELYKNFCMALKKARTPGYGVRLVKGNIFKNYPIATLEYQKKIFCSNLEIKSNTLTKSTIIDWKYMEITDFYNESMKLDSDINKQLCYEHCLLASKPFSIEDKVDNWFAIPCFYSNESEYLTDFEKLQDCGNLYSKLKSNNIDIYKFDFIKIQKIYLDND